MLRFALFGVALVVLSGCSSIERDARAQQAARSHSSELQARARKICVPNAGKPCDVTVIVSAKAPPAPGGKDCSEVTFKLDEPAQPILQELEIKKGVDANILFKLDSTTATFAFFGSNPVSLYNSPKNGPPPQTLHSKVDVKVDASGKQFEWRLKSPKDKEEFHFGVALGTAMGGCAGDPRIINGS